MIIGFATSCMNRRWQLEETLERNLLALSGTPHFIALVDYNSADDLGELVKRFDEFVLLGSLVYFRTTEPTSFHMSMAKNTAHRLALRRSPDVVFNLDGDNRVSAATISVVEEVFTEARASCLHNWDGRWSGGTCGRVALTAESWQALGGYDEKLLPVAWQDIDLLYRARAIGLRYRQVDVGVGDPVSNSYGEKIANVVLPEGLLASSRKETYNLATTANIITSLGRPVRLPFEEQQRFSGVLNFSEEVVI